MGRLMIKKTLLWFICLCPAVLWAQGMKDIRINEILVKNVDSYEDDYGHRVGWVELFNSGYSNVNVAGSYLSVDFGNKSLTYKIPKNDPRTVIPPQGYLIFFADGIGSKGTFYTNFTLDKTGKLYLIDANGRTIVDSVRYDLAAMKEDQSIGWKTEAAGTDPVWTELEATTPGAVNDVAEFESKAELFRQHDPKGIIMAITAMSVVFLALILLYLVFKQVGKSHVKRAKNKAAANTVAVSAAGVSGHTPNGEIIAAIAIALKKYEEDRHDIESAVLTINRVAKAYSPWSSKIYSMVQMPERKPRR